MHEFLHEARDWFVALVTVLTGLVLKRWYSDKGAREKEIDELLEERRVAKRQSESKKTKGHSGHD